VPEKKVKNVRSAVIKYLQSNFDLNPFKTANPKIRSKDAQKFQGVVGISILNEYRTSGTPANVGGCTSKLWDYALDGSEGFM
jgi:hypothetical protein